MWFGFSKLSIFCWEVTKNKNFSWFRKSVKTFQTSFLTFTTTRSTQNKMASKLVCTNQVQEPGGKFPQQSLQTTTLSGNSFSSIHPKKKGRILDLDSEFIREFMNDSFSRSWPVDTRFQQNENLGFFLFRWWGFDWNGILAIDDWIDGITKDKN